MANRDNPHGLRPVMRTLSGGVPHVLQYDKLVGYGTGIFIHDAVNLVNGVLQVSATPGTGPYHGVNIGPYGPASTATSHIISVATNAVYEAQDNNDTDGLALADMGKTANIELNAGNTATGISGHELDESTVAATGKDVQLLQKYDVPDNDYGSNARIEVVFNLIAGN